MMSEMLLLLADLGQVVKTLVAGAIFSSDYFYAAAAILIFYLFGIYRRTYTLKSIFPKLKSVIVTTVFYVVSFVAFMPVVIVLHEKIRAIHGSLALPRLDAEVWQGVPSILLFVITLLSIDFVRYWGHRLMHGSWLWPSHAIHHSDSNMNGLTSYRIHFVEIFMMGLAYILLLSFLNLPGNVLPFGAVFATLYGVYIHMEMDWGHGPLRFLLASPRFHRWHHADEPQAYGKNLAGMFPFYDVAFGTYYVPDTFAAQVGARGVPEHNPAAMLIHPFMEWSRMVSKAVGRFGRAG